MRSCGASKYQLVSFAHSAKRLREEWSEGVRSAQVFRSLIATGLRFQIDACPGAMQMVVVQNAVA